MRAGRPGPRAREGHRGREGAHADLRRHRHPQARRGRARLVHRPPHLLRRRRGAHVPAALAAHRADRGGTARPRAAQQALLPPLARRQGREAAREARQRRSGHRSRAHRVSRSPRVTPPPSAPYRYEAQAWRAGVALVAGLDEAGRGPLAGPVVAAAVVFDPARRVKRLADSKLLTPERREELYALIHERAVAVGVGIVDHLTIDRGNILQATILALSEALAGLGLVPGLVITDFVKP